MSTKRGVGRWEEITSGYRFSLVSGAIACLVTLLLNLSVTIWAATLSGDDGRGRRILYEGSCSTSKSINTGLHILINVLSSILLGASNYGIQCLSAPTRGQVDEAHAAESYLDIGIVSFRNLQRQSVLTRMLWVTLILSSLPLHLLYNSVVFSSLTVPDEYNILFIDEKINAMAEVDLLNGTMYEDNAWVRDLITSARHGHLDKLEPLRCMNEYAVSFQTSREDVILIQEMPDGNRSIETSSDHAIANSDEPYSWICPGNDLEEEEEPCQSRLDTIKEEPENWRPDGHRVKYCLSKRLAEQLCRVNFNLYLAIGVILSNLIKMAILAYIAVRLAPDRLLVLGDAIQSFMAHPDPQTRCSCLVSMQDVRYSYYPDGKAWSGERVLTAMRKRWITPVGMSLVAVGAIL